MKPYEMLEDYILRQLPIREDHLFHRLRSIARYEDWTKALRQLLRDGELRYEGRNLIPGDHAKHEGFVMGIGEIW